MSMYTILIRDTGKEFLCSSAEKRPQFKELLNALASHGVWPGGFEVKTAGGQSASATPITILEGQLAGTQLLLTPSHRDGQGLVYLWQFTPAGGQAAANPPFLQALSHSANRIADLSQCDPAWYCSEETIAQACEPQRWYPLDAENWQRIKEEGSELTLWLDPEEKKALDQPLPVLLSGTAGSGKTTVAIYRLLDEYRESLTSPASPAPRRLLYVTYSEALKRHARDLFEKLLLKEEKTQEVGFPEKVDRLFRTYREICLEQLQPYPEFGDFEQDSREETLTSFYARLQGQINAQGVTSADPTLVWEEIRSVLKGSKDSARYPGGLLPRKEYQHLGPRAAALFPTQRDKIYEIARWYQNELRLADHWDEIDMARAAYQVAEQQGAQYDVIVCDEAQDLTELQLHLLFHLCKNHDNLFFTGDEHQILNPSGFRWGDIRTAFYEQRPNPPAPSSLVWNHRSAGPIVALSNALLRLKHGLLAGRRHVPQQQARWAGEPPYIIEDVEDQHVLDVLLRGADRAIIVRTKEQQDALRTRLGTELVHTIYEAKGLEWETILLWRFFDDRVVGADSKRTKNVAHPVTTTRWRRILQAWESLVQGAGDALSQQGLSEAMVDHEISLLHVSLTRARRRLFIYDGQTPEKLWKHPQLCRFILPTSLAYVRQSWQKASTPGEWWDRGREYFDRKVYMGAAECFEEAGDEVFHNESLACHHQAERQWGEAAKYWRRAGRNLRKVRKDAAGKDDTRSFAFKRFSSTDSVQALQRISIHTKELYKNAAQCWEEAKQYCKAERCYKLSSDRVEAIRCKAEALEQEAEALGKSGKAEECRSKCAEAGHKWEEYAQRLSPPPVSGTQAPAAQQLQKRRRALSRAAQAYGKAKRYEEAIRLFAQAQEWVAAGERCREIVMRSLAAQFFEQGQAWARAAADWEHIGSWSQAERCWTQAGQRGRARPCQVKESINQHKWQEAARYYEERQQWLRASRYWLLASDAEKAAKCSAAGRAQEHERIGSFAEAAAEWAKGEKWEQAARCWEAVGQRGLTASVWGNAASAWERCKKWQEAASCWEKAGHWESAAEAWAIAQAWGKARACWQKSSHQEKEFHVLYCTYEDLMSKKAEDKARAEPIQTELRALMFEVEELWDASAQRWQELNKWDKAAECWEKAEQWDKAIDCWQKTGLGPHAAVNRWREQAALKARIQRHVILLW